jgi:acyl carrier protein
MLLETTIRKFILENYLFTDDDSLLKNDVSLIETGIIDSTGILELISFIQKTFDIKVEDEEMIPENLDSVDSVVAYVRRKGAVKR